MKIWVAAYTTVWDCLAKKLYRFVSILKLVWCSVLIFLQDQNMPSFKLKHFDLPNHLAELSENTDFNKAVTVRPVITNEDFFRLNAHFLKVLYT